MGSRQRFLFSLVYHMALVALRESGPGIYGLSVDGHFLGCWFRLLQKVSVKNKAKTPADLCTVSISFLWL